MVEESLNRIIAAILSADVEGYSRLMGDNEAATIRTLTDYREAITGLIEQYRGRVVDAPGDNLLAEFGSVVDAVNCAVEIQKELSNRNSKLPNERKMQFRIGVNLGDIVEEEGRIYGDGVNIAARVEGLAEGGGICISGRAYDQVENKLDLEYKFLGEKKVKNITRPVRAYKVLLYSGAGDRRAKELKKSMRKKWLYGVLGVIVLLILVAGAIWNTYFRLPYMKTLPAGKIDVALPQGPSVAVLPFVNLSDDPEQEYFSDGLTDNIITGLSSVRRLLVIARNSTFTYKDKPVKVQEVGRELGAKYVVEGSVQKSKDRVRINVQLIEANTGHHLWAQKYDRDLKELLSLQDEITIKIMTELGVVLTDGEQVRAWSKKVTSVDVFMQGLRAYSYYNRTNKEDNALAQQLLKELIVLDPENSVFYSLLSVTYIQEIIFDHDSSPIFCIAQATKYAKKAISLDINDPTAHLAISYLYLIQKQSEKAIAASKQAIALSPSLADAYFMLALCHRVVGRLEEAIKIYQKAFRLNPMPPSRYYAHVGLCNLLLGQNQKAIDNYKQAININPKNLWAHVGLTAAYIQGGREKEARGEALEVLKINPEYSVDHHESSPLWKKQEHKKQYFQLLRKAGLE